MQEKGREGGREGGGGSEKLRLITSERQCIAVRTSSVLCSKGERKSRSRS